MNLVPSDRYEVRNCLGTGGMGTVHVAFDKSLQRDVAIKTIRPDLMASPVLRARFAREALALSRLNHPGLCRVFDVGEHNHAPFFVMPLLKGHTLAEWLQHAKDTRGLVDDNGSTNPSSRDGVIAAIAMIEKVARALHHAHLAGLVHRDLNPRNIMIREDGEPVVLDFGLAHDSDQSGGRLTQTGQHLGTLEYASPEQVRGLQVSDCRSDVYSLGVTLFEYVTLSRPFRGEPGFELPDQICSRPTPNPRRRNRAISTDLRTVIEMAMNKDSGRRYRTALDFAEDLRRVRLGHPIRAQRPELRFRLKSWMSHNSATAVVLAILSFSLAIALYAFGVHSALATENHALAESATQQRQIAEHQTTMAQQRLSDFDRLAAVIQLTDAKNREQELYPAWPHNVPKLIAWLADYGEPLLLEHKRVRTTLSTLQRADHRPIRESRTGALADHRPKAESDEFLRSVLKRLDAALLEFGGATGSINDARRRLAWAREIQSLTLHHPNGRISWQQAADAIAKADGVVASKLYSHQPITLEAQTGLVPIGMNPVTKLWEFYHLRSAVEPATGSSAAEVSIPEHESDGTIKLGPDTGIVFVLIPGMRNIIGAQAMDPHGPGYDPYARRGEQVLTGTLQSFFLAKYEMTQGQWMRLSGGENPSRKPAGTLVGSYPITELHPVEGVSWQMCQQLLTRNGLRLPDEWEWEFGCRARSTTPWFPGSNDTDLAGFANVYDLSAKKFKFFTGEAIEIDDGYLPHAPVGTYKANGFGLHDTHGNISEWCSNRYVAINERRVIRGGNFSSLGSHLIRSAARKADGPTTQYHAFGVRPARELR